LKKKKNHKRRGKGTHPERGLKGKGERIQYKGKKNPPEKNLRGRTLVRELQRSETEKVRKSHTAGQGQKKEPEVKKESNNSSKRKSSKRK